MSDAEKVSWLRALAVILGANFAPVLLLALSGPTSDGNVIASGALVSLASMMAIYLLILSWRSAYISGSKSARRWVGALR